MYKQRLNYAIIGTFVTAMLVAGIISIAMLTGRTGPVDRYFIVLDNVSDVKFGTQVRYEGYPIGQVEVISPVAEGAGMTFRVDISVKLGWRIPADSVARIGSSSFLAAKTIDIQSGESATAVALGARIASAPPVDIFSTISATAAEINDLKRKNLTPLLNTLQGLAQSVEGSTPRLMQEVMAFAEGLNASLEPLQSILAQSNIEAVQNSIENLEETAVNLAAISKDLTKTMKTVDHLASGLDTMVEENTGNVDQSLNDVRYSLSAVAGTVDAIIHNLEGTMRNMNEFSRLIRQNPGLLLDGTPREAVSPARATTSGSDNQG